MEQSKYSKCKQSIKKYLDKKPKALLLAQKKYLEKNKLVIMEYQKEYQQDYYRWTKYLTNTSWKYENQLFLQILI